ncbi:MAG: Nramp family divalent metal transporter [Candidatus Dormibacteraeota bacterium]|nr:Nramp family divalent metal transporter [Candidatus Dormibacteraeota bacterium]
MSAEETRQARERLASDQLRGEALSPAEQAGAALPGERQVADAAHRSLRGDVRGLRALLPFMGPAFVAAVAYVDPGNFASNLTSGATYGYLLLWVVLGANVIAMVVQSLSARLGIATGQNLAEVCRERFPRPVVLALWVQAELVAMATDLAEFVGAALGLNLLFGVPLLPAALLTGLATFGILTLQSRGVRHLEAVITGMVGVMVLAFTVQIVLARPSLPDIVRGSLLPRFDGTQSILLATSILGATVMPHVIYLHSALTQRRVVGRTAQQRWRIYRFERLDVIVAMGVAGLVNMTMLALAASVFFHRSGTDIQNLNQVAATLGEVLGFHANWIFGLALLASGLSSSSVGTLAGQVVMQGFIQKRVPVLLRRVVTMLPALFVIGLGLDPTHVLLLSQVALSFGIPFALVPLVLFTRSRQVMGSLVTNRMVNAVAYAVVGLIVSLNVFLLWQTFTNS